MKRIKIRVSDIKSGEELEQVWRESEGGLPGLEAWGRAIENRRVTSLAARRAARALGYVSISWAGPFPREEEFLAVVNEHFAELPPTPAIYGLHVHPAHRRQGIATTLMDEVERRILERGDIPHRAVLHVNANNQPAIRLYASLDYKNLLAGENYTITVDLPEWDSQKKDWASKHAIAIPMVKELQSD